MKKHTGIELMETAPVGMAIIRLALPVIAATLAQAIYNMTDMFFIGQAGDLNMVAAVSLAFPLFLLIQALGNIFATGGSSYISRLLGAKKNEDARLTASVSFYSAMGIGLLVTVTLWIFEKPLLRLIGASGATFAHLDNYFSILSIFIAIAAGGTVLSGMMRSEGATNKAMTAMLTGIALNIILDPIFILWFGWGTAGAAWATVVGQTASFIYGITYFLSKKTLLSVKPANFKPNKIILAQIVSIGIPAELNTVVTMLTYIMINRIASGYGDFVVAGNGIQMRIITVWSILILGLSLGYQPFAGFNYGAKNHDRLRKGFRLTMLYATVVCITGSVILRLFGEMFIRFFINDGPAIEAGAAMINVFVWGLPFISANMTVMVSFQAFGKPVQAMVIGSGRALLLIPLLYLFNYLFGFNGFILARPAVDILTTAGIILVFIRPLFRLMRGEKA
ncbi:MATE family efflux transporter [Hollandina sp. SP2]